MPEMPEVEGLRAHLAQHCTGRFIDRVELASIAALKSVGVPVDQLLGSEITAVTRHGKFLALHAGQTLVIHLARAGWLRWYDVLPAARPKPGRGPIALRLGLDDGTGFDLTEAGTRKGLALHVVDSPGDVRAIAALGADPLTLGLDSLTGILATAGRAQLKGVLRDQTVLAGIGNAWSDEILHAARMSPFTPANSLDESARCTLLDAIATVLTDAVARCVGHPPSALKDAKRSRMNVHGRTGDPCPVCGTPVATVAFADRSMQYCPGCQTGGKPLADRRMSRLLK